MTDIALYFEPEAYSLDTKLLMGRQAAGAAFFRAYAETQPGRAWCFSRERKAFDSFGSLLRRHGCVDTQIEWIGVHDVARLGDAGLMYRPDPAIAADAWRRLQHATPGAYSLCGITHTTATHAVMDCFARLLTDPLEEWDAIVCTSDVVRDSLLAIVGAQAEYLRERLGTQIVRLPQLPVIPLGVHTDDFISTDEARAQARKSFDIAEDETVFLYVGRLSYANKAHPLPMFLGLEAAAVASGRRVTLIQAGWHETEAVAAAFAADARALCPSVRGLDVDGRDATARRRAWAAADVFTSLPDSIQETFGLTPIEAMAAGLPVVVSDWDGYKETVRDGVDGFRIPTMSMPAGAGQSLADRFDVGLDDYHVYCGVTAQLVSIDVAAAADAYRRLIEDPALRRRMGTAGQERAKSLYDWAVIMRRYAALWDELGARRRAGAASGLSLSRRVRPDRADPFTVFAGYPSAIIAPDTAMLRTGGATPDAARARRGLASVAFAEMFLPAQSLVDEILVAMPEETWVQFDALRRHLPQHAPLSLAAGVVWLGKLGLLRLAPAVPA